MILRASRRGEWDIVECWSCWAYQGHDTCVKEEGPQAHSVTGVILAVGFCVAGLSFLLSLSPGILTMNLFNFIVEEAIASGHRLSQGHLLLCLPPVLGLIRGDGAHRKWVGIPLCAPHVCKDLGFALSGLRPHLSLPPYPQKVMPLSV